MSVALYCPHLCRYCYASMERIHTIPKGRECAANKIPVMAYSPIGEGYLLNHPALEKVAQRHNATPVQIALAWVIRRPGIIAIPKAGSVAHLEENFHSLSICLTDEDLQELDVAYPAPTRKIPLAGW